METTLWKSSANRAEYPTLDHDIICDAVVIGGGLCGMLCAYKLSRLGLKVALLEAERIGSGQTSGTTAKITVAHSNIYSRIADELGEHESEIYASAATHAIDEYEDIIMRENIDCGFSRLSSYLYTLYGERLIYKEYDAARRAGLSCGIEKSVELPFEVACALKFPNQAQFNPIKFLHGIAHGFEIYENSRALEIHDGKIICENGSVSAKFIITATNYPLFGDLKSMFPIRLHRRMAHVYTFSGVPAMQNMYIGIDGGYNYRSSDDILIVSGENHVSGEGTGGAYERLKDSTLSSFKNAVPYIHWSAEDSVAIDKIPVIGRMHSTGGDILTCCGFMTWGMTSSMVAADIISDTVCGRGNPAASLFTPKRFHASASMDELGGMVSRAASGIIGASFKVPEEELAELRRGEGAIVRYMGQKYAAFRDENGAVHLSDPRCPHLKCELCWNGDDRTWDCPCHGSRFDIDGRLLTGPAEHSVCQC